MSFVDYTSRYIYREATIDDADTLAKFQITMAKETEGIDLDPETVYKGVRIPFAHPSLATYYVAEEKVDGDAASSSSSPAASSSTPAVNPRIVSGLMVTNEFNVFENSMMWWIQSVYTVPEHRRRGLFANLYAFVKKKVEADPSVLGLRLYVEHENEAAQRSYAKLGMKVDPYQMAKEMKGSI